MFKKVKWEEFCLWIVNGPNDDTALTTKTFPAVSTQNQVLRVRVRPRPGLTNSTDN